MRDIAKRVFSRVARLREQPMPRVVELKTRSSPHRGRVLFSYIIAPLILSDHAQGFLLHSNWWEARELVRLFLEMDFAVDVIDFRDDTFVPQKRYDIVLDISWNLARLAELIEPNTLKLLHLTGSDPFFQNAAELHRVQELNARRKANCSPVRQVPKPEIARESIRVANYCSLVGNEITLSTFPETVRDKISLVPVSASKITVPHRVSEAIPRARHFLWFFGFGAIHKGLDRVLEVFRRNPQWTLHVIGNVLAERDFASAYKFELRSLSNIHVHGYLAASSRQFVKATQNVFAFIAPSCSEGISPAVVTCLQLGFYPILSRNTGADLPDKCGQWLDTCSIEEIEETVAYVRSMSDHQLRSEISQIQSFALRQYSRESFRAAMQTYLVSSLESTKRPG